MYLSIIAVTRYKSMIDDILVIYENSGKYFGSYYSAFMNGKRPGSKKEVYYVFTPTMQKCRRVCELENLYRKYFSKHHCTYYDFKNKTEIEQLNLLKEV